MKVEKNNRGAFISHDGLTIFFNNDGTVKVTIRDNSDGYNVWYPVGDMKADKESFHQLGDLLRAL